MCYCICEEMDEEAIRQSSEEQDARISSEVNVSKSENKHVTGASGEEEDSEDDEQQTGTTGGNLLARFSMVQDVVNPSSSEQTNGAQSSDDLHQDGDGVGVSTSTPQLEEQNTVDDNTKWMQRASWKSLMGIDGRAAFSLKQVTGEAEAARAPTDVKKSEKPAVPEQQLGTFSFNFARNPPETSASTTSRKNPINSKRTEKVPSDSPLDKSVKPAKVTDDEAGCSFMKSADADKEWRASRNELRIDSKAKHKAAVRKMKKMKGSGGAR